jgi:predicted metal-dependent phosphoesterase TrpH
MLIDLHIHTTAYSPCSTMTPDELMVAAKAAGLDGVCITEHNRIWSAEEAAELADKHGLAVFRGMEITSSGGDILVFGLEEEPGSQIWTPAELRAKVEAAGGVAFAAHPFRGFLLFGFSHLQMNIEDAIGNPTFAHVHGLEVCNCMVTPDENALASQAAEALGLLQVGGSDAHRPNDVGTCVTRFPERIENEKELIAALRSGNFVVERTK